MKRLLILIILLIPIYSIYASDGWETFYEKNNNGTPRYAETIAYFQKLADKSPLVHIEEFGKSAAGRSLKLVIISADQAFSPDLAKITGKPVILVENCIHPGESEGKDACMMLARDMAIYNKYPDILDSAILLIIPILNTDGHEQFGRYNRINQNGPEEMGWRVTATRLNLNRDFMKADTPEMRACLRLFDQWHPHLFVDTHTTDGQDFQYDLSYNIDVHPDFGGELSTWAQNIFLPDVLPLVESKGHLIGPYAGLIDKKDASKGLSSGVWPPRLSNPYVTLRNRAGFLIETHALKPYPIRVQATYDLIWSILDHVSRHPAELLTAVAQEDSSCREPIRPGELFPFTFRLTDKSVPMVYHGYSVETQFGPVANEDYFVYHQTPKDVQTMFFNDVKPSFSVTIPYGYLIPACWHDVIEILSLHGLEMETLHGSATDSFEVYRFKKVSFGSTPYEGRHRVSYQTIPSRERLTVSSDYVYVPAAQQFRKILLHLLEPQAPDALLRWGFFNTIFEEKEYFEQYIMEPMAQRMMDKNPQLKAEFLTKLRTDSTFAADSHQRLQFFYKRSPYWDPNLNRYPVLRVINPLKASIITGD